MVSKRNRNRKTAEKIAKPADKPAEKIAKPAEINIEQILTAVTQKVVEVLKPDLQQKIEAVQTSLSNQIKAEMQDLREHLPSLPQQPIQDQPIPPQQPISQLPRETQTDPQNPQQNMAGQILPLLLQAIRPADSSSELMKMFLQTQMRTSMSKTTYADWFQEEMMKKMAKDYLGTSIPDSVQKSSEHFMKPIRDIGVRAEQAKQESENKQ